MFSSKLQSELKESLAAQTIALEEYQAFFETLWETWHLQASGVGTPLWSWTVAIGISNRSASS